VRFSIPIKVLNPYCENGWIICGFCRHTLEARLEQIEKVKYVTFFSGIGLKFV
jgi:hypothetical protein